MAMTAPSTCGSWSRAKRAVLSGPCPVSRIATTSPGRKALVGTRVLPHASASAGSVPRSHAVRTASPCGRTSRTTARARPSSGGLFAASRAKKASIFSRARGLVLLLADEALDAHALEDVVLAGDRLRGPPLGVVTAGGLRQAAEDRRLGDRQVRHVGIEELPRRCRNPVRTRTEVDLVQVEVEDVVLAELRLEPERQHELLELPLEAPFGSEEERLHDLLGDRAAALHHLTMQDVHHQRARDAERVDTAVAIEIGILGGEESEPDVRGD